MAAEAKGQYSAILLGATGNVGGRIAQLLIENPLCKKVIVVTRRKTDAFAAPKVSEVVVNIDRLEEEVAPHALGVDVALAAFGVGKGSARMPEDRCARWKSLPADLLPRRQHWRRSCMRGHGSSGRGPRGLDEVREDHGEKEKAVDVRQIRIPWGVSSCRHSRQLQHAGRSWLRHANAALGYAVQVPLDPKNDLARAMVAQSQQAFLAFAQGNAPKKATVKILEYKEMKPFFVTRDSNEP